MRTRSNYKTFDLTEKTKGILAAVDAFGFRTYSELRSSVLKNHSRQQAWRTMKRLSQAGLIREIRDSEGNLLGWSPKEQINIPSPCTNSDSKIERGKIPKYSSHFEHDKQVRWALDQFENLKSVKKITAESKLKMEIFSGIRSHSKREMNQMLALIPDASLIIENGSNHYKIAFEMELSRKSNHRVQEKLEYYIAKSSYDIILYVCGSESVYQHIFKNYQTVISDSPAAKFAKQKAVIYLCDSSEFKNDFGNAKFKSLHDEFTINEILG